MLRLCAKAVAGFGVTEVDFPGMHAESFSLREIKHAVLLIQKALESPLGLQG
jgi:hypothetical protein